MLNSITRHYQSVLAVTDQFRQVQPQEVVDRN